MDEDYRILVMDLDTRGEIATALLYFVDLLTPLMERDEEGGPWDTAWMHLGTLIKFLKGEREERR